MKVYITFSGEKYEASYITGVYTTYADAHTSLDLPDMEPHNYGEGRACWFPKNDVDYVSIEEHDVEGVTVDFLNATIIAKKMAERIKDDEEQAKIQSLAQIFGINREAAEEIYYENS